MIFLRGFGLGFGFTTGLLEVEEVALEVVVGFTVVLEDDVALLVALLVAAADPFIVAFTVAFTVALELIFTVGEGFAEGLFVAACALPPVIVNARARMNANFFSRAPI